MISVSDRDLLIPDPDLDPIRIQGFDDQKRKKINRWKKNLKLFEIKNCNLLTY
jgi:hypothetical protein